MKSNITFGLVLTSFVIFSIVLLASSDTAYGAQTVTDMVRIGSSDLPGGLEPMDGFGWDIENIGDLDGDGVDDLAVTKWGNSGRGLDLSSVEILFMNNNGTVNGTNEIELNTTASGIGASCIAADGSNSGAMSLNGLAFVGDLDGDGKPTLALGAETDTHDDIFWSGAIYMLELDSDGTVDNCFRITPNTSSYTSGFAPADEFYPDRAGPQLGRILIATDLNGDGQNELIAGVQPAIRNGWVDGPLNLWPLFLNSTGGVASHPAVPILGAADIGLISDLNYPSDTINGGTKIVIGESDQTITGGSVFIVNLNSTGGYVNSTQIRGDSLGQGLVGSSIWQTAGHLGLGVGAISDMDDDGVVDIMAGSRLGVFILYLNSNDTVKESQGIPSLMGGSMELWTNNSTLAVIAVGNSGDSTQGYVAGAIHLVSVERAFTPPPPNPDDQSDPDVPIPTTTIPPPTLTFIQQTALIQQLQDANNEMQTQIIGLEGIVIQLQATIQSIQNQTTINPQNPTTTNNTQNTIEPIQTETPTVQAIPADAVKPQAPNNLRIIAGVSQVTLSWDEPENGGTPITSYYVWWFDAGGNKQSAYHNSSLGTTLTLTGMVGNEEYRFRIAAVNALGIGNSSNEVLVTPN